MVLGWYAWLTSYSQPEPISVCKPELLILPSVPQFGKKHIRIQQQVDPKSVIQLTASGAPVGIEIDDEMQISVLPGVSQLSGKKLPFPTKQTFFSDRIGLIHGVAWK